MLLRLQTVGCALWALLHIGVGGEGRFVLNKERRDKLNFWKPPKGLFKTSSILQHRAYFGSAYYVVETSDVKLEVTLERSQRLSSHATFPGVSVAVYKRASHAGYNALSTLEQMVLKKDDSRIPVDQTALKIPNANTNGDDVLLAFLTYPDFNGFLPALVGFTCPFHHIPGGIEYTCYKAGTKVQLNVSIMDDDIQARLKFLLKTHNGQPTAGNRPMIAYVDVDLDMRDMDKPKLSVLNLDLGEVNDLKGISGISFSVIDSITQTYIEGISGVPKQEHTKNESDGESEKPQDNRRKKNAYEKGSITGAGFWDNQELQGHDKVERQHSDQVKRQPHDQVRRFDKARAAYAKQVIHKIRTYVHQKSQDIRQKKLQEAESKSKVAEHIM